MPPHPRVLVSGASIAGPSAALWLARLGADVTVVERAPDLRPGGFAVDFRGAPHLTALERMGVLDAVRERRTRNQGLDFVDARDRVLVALPASFLGGDVEIERGDLARLLYERTAGEVEYLFSDWIERLVDTGERVDVDFASGAEASYDLVIGADGLRSGVRRLVFGPDEAFLVDSGYRVAGGFQMPNVLRLDWRTHLYNEPGRSLSIAGGFDPAAASPLFVWYAGVGAPLPERDLAAQRRAVRAAFAGMAWQGPAALHALEDAQSVYLDSLSQVRMTTSSRGRVVLVGDAGFGATMGGLGTGLAVISAYVLAGALARHGFDHQPAFAAYDAQIRPYARGCQGVADGTGPFLAPRTHAGIRLRNVAHRVLTWGPLARWLERMTRAAASDITLDDGAWAPAASGWGTARSAAVPT